MTDDSEINKGGLGATLLGEYGSASYRLGQTLAASDTDPTTAFKARDKALEAALVFMRRREDEVDHLKATRDYFAAESKRNVEVARSLHAKNEKLGAQVKELDRLNGDLHDQIRAKDAEILRLKDELKDTIRHLHDEPTLPFPRNNPFDRYSPPGVAMEDSELRHFADKIETLTQQVELQRSMVDQAMRLLEHAATMTWAAQAEAGQFHEKLQAAEAALHEARSQRDEAIRKLHE